MGNEGKRPGDKKEFTWTCGLAAWEHGPQEGHGVREKRFSVWCPQGVHLDKWRRMCWWASQVDVSGKQVEGQGRGVKTAWTVEGFGRHLRGRQLKATQ